jgi:hypothetical protein
MGRGRKRKAPSPLEHAVVVQSADMEVIEIVEVETTSNGK